MTHKDHDVDLKATERHSIESLEDRLRESEEFNATLTHLLVASYRLHSSLDYVELIRIIKEIMINLVGAKVFGVFLVDKKKNAITMITNEGFDANAKEQCGRIAKKIIATGELWYAGNKMLGASGPIKRRCSPRTSTYSRCSVSTRPRRSTRRSSRPSSRRKRR
jgi:hypothetical protein